MNTRSVLTSAVGGRQDARFGNAASRSVTVAAAKRTGTYMLMTSEAPCHWSHANIANTKVITSG